MVRARRGFSIREVARPRAQIARVAMWLADHQANIEASRTLGQNFVNLPLTQAAHIRHGDALETDWAEHLGLEPDAARLRGVYVMGNPPFVGSYLMSPEQKRQVLALFASNAEAGVLDYVAAWYLKSAQLLRHMDKTWPHLRVGASLVSTNSVTQGEQVPHPGQRGGSAKDASNVLGVDEVVQLLDDAAPDRVDPVGGVRVGAVQR